MVGDHRVLISRIGTCSARVDDLLIHRANLIFFLFALQVRHQCVLDSITFTVSLAEEILRGYLR